MSEAVTDNAIQLPNEIGRNGITGRLVTELVLAQAGRDAQLQPATLNDEAHAEDLHTSLKRGD